MIEKIKNHFLNQRFKNNIQKSRNENYSLGEKINKIGILLDGRLEIEENVFKSFITMFKVSAKNLHFLVLKDQTVTSEIISYRTDYVSRKDFDFMGNLKLSDKTFFENRHDLQINYFDRPDPALLCLASKTKRCLRIGFSGSDDRLNDLIFNFSPTATKAFLDESQKYLSPIYNY